ncbi:MAG: TonB-dependent copper receptor [Methylophilaceae bacterium]|nr:TonB-dependent copper receptor [Methylophilaceae bacterium]
MFFSRSQLAAALMLAMPSLAHAVHEEIRLDDVVVTAPGMDEPLTVVTDPKAPRQPVPAHDGADYLKTIPGFSVMRKGGTDGEPILRGMAGSRINILVDGQNVLGGCSMRMDAPTAYIFPEAFDRLTVLKGPQTVLHGPGASAGTVLFDRHLHPMAAPGIDGNASLLLGNHGRHDEVADLKFGSEKVYARITGTNSQANNYRDGDGNTVHSEYHRYSANAALGFTPDADSGLELSAAYSDGEAAYADRGMDGIEFKRENLALRAEKRNLSERVRHIEFRLSHNNIDHLMDDYSMRDFNPANFMGWARLQHRSNGGKLAGTFRLADATDLTVGASFQVNVHAKGSGGGAGMMAMMPAAVRDDSRFENTALFGELTHGFSPDDRLIIGYRADHWEAKDKRDTMGSDTAGRSRNETLHSGFVRFESDLKTLPATAYVGLGRVERFPDYWELVASTRAGGDAMMGAGRQSAFLVTDPEKTTQLDLGLISGIGRLRASVSAFYNQIDDFILIDRNPGFAVFMGMPSMVMNGSSRNIDAHTWGGEIDLAYRFTEEWKLNSSLAYVRGENETDGRPLAQLPPLEFKLGLTYDNKTWFAGGLLRMVAEQDRYATGQGNIAGTDLGRSGGFSVFSLNAGWRPTQNSLITAGVDNLFDKSYAEFVSRAGGNGMGGAITGFTQTTRVNEPGRTFWIKGNITF